MRWRILQSLSKGAIRAGFQHAEPIVAPVAPIMPPISQPPTPLTDRPRSLISPRTGQCVEFFRQDRNDGTSPIETPAGLADIDFYVQSGSHDRGFKNHYLVCTCFLLLRLPSCLPCVLLRRPPTLDRWHICSLFAPEPFCKSVSSSSATRSSPHHVLSAIGLCLITSFRCRRILTPAPTQDGRRRSPRIPL
jgi:hypothetical protein